jgi:hypothetical protein
MQQWVKPLPDRPSPLKRVEQIVANSQQYLQAAGHRLLSNIRPAALLQVTYHRPLLWRI